MFWTMRFQGRGILNKQYIKMTINETTNSHCKPKMVSHATLPKKVDEKQLLIELWHHRKMAQPMVIPVRICPKITMPAHVAIIPIKQPISPFSFGDYLILISVFN